MTTRIAGTHLSKLCPLLVWRKYATCHTPFLVNTQEGGYRLLHIRAFLWSRSVLRPLDAPFASPIGPLSIQAV